MNRYGKFSHKAPTKNFTFVEVLVGLAITSLLLGVVFTSLYEMSLARSRLAKAEKEILSRAEFQQRLNTIFTNLVPPETQGYFFCLTQNAQGEGELCVRFRCGIDPDSSFSDQVLGILETKEQGLILRVIGNTKDHSFTEREEILRRGVTKVKYEFLRQGDFSTIWDKKRTHPPNYLKLTLLLGKDKEENYVFWVNKKPVGVFIP